MSLRKLAIFGVLGALLGSGRVSAEPKSFSVRGQQVVLDVARDVVLVRPKGQVKVLDVATEAVQMQSKLLGKQVGPTALHLVRNPPKHIKQLGGVFVTRLAGLEDAQVPQIAELSDQLESSELVYAVNQQHFVPAGTITVRFNGPPQARLLFALSNEFNLKEAGRPKYASNVVRFEPLTTGADPFALCKRICQQGNVRWAEPDLVFELTTCSPPKHPNDTHFSKQWYLQSGDAGINAPQAWGISEGTDQITVAVIDDGVDTQHKEFKGKLVPGYDFFDDDPDPRPDPKDAHGTACAGIIAALSSNSQGTAGIAWHCKIMPIKIFNKRKCTTSAATAEAFHWAMKNGAKVINCSWAAPIPYNQEWDAIETVTKAGCLIIASAANSGKDERYHFVHFPAGYKECVAIGAVKPDNTRWPYSCWGPPLELVAPSSDGVTSGIWTTDHSGANGYNNGTGDAEEPTGDYTGYFSGTSAAAPVVSGVAALVWSTYPKLKAEDIRQILRETATKIDPANGDWDDGHSNYYGWGKVNALAALQRAGQLASGGTPISEEERGRYIKSMEKRPQAPRP